MIDVLDAVKTYGEVRVVDGVRLALPSGGLTSIIGPNGAGKSTLLSLVARLVGLDGGRVLVDGLDVTTTKSDVLARRIAALRQENHLASRLTVRDLVTFGRYPHSKGRTTPEDLEHVARAIEFLDLGSLADRFLDEMSGGQRQRAFVAMVLCQDTDVLLLDEPLNNLDPRHAVAMMERLRAAADQLGKTVVVVVHDINVAAYYSDHIVAMSDGAVMFEGPPHAVICPEVLSDVYGLPVSVHTIEGRPHATYFR
ncbi:MAG: ATP-binding cassette domain-containing protein [Actinomycetales bacterium]|nr:ATP-binding cassette domain-containing protein [Actinomycetales bacterium]